MKHLGELAERARAALENGGPVSGGSWIDAEAVKKRYADVSDATLWRWVRDKRFPPPSKICGRKLWHTAALDAFDRELLNGGQK